MSLLSEPGLTLTDDLQQHRALIEQALAREGQILSTFSFINLFAWQGHFRFDVERIGGALCIFAGNALGRFLYLPPLGGGLSGELIEECFRRMNPVNPGPGVSRIENVPLSQVALFPEDKFDRYLKGYDYLYARKDLVELKGNHYKSKRWACNHFVKNTRYQYKPFEPGMAEEAMALYDAWAESRRRARDGDEAYAFMLEENRDVYARVITDARDLGLIGRAVFVNGRLKATTFGYPLVPCELTNRGLVLKALAHRAQAHRVFCVLFEVADLALTGLPALIFREFCADPLLKDYTWINAMDDSGMESLARTKGSFHPACLAPSYTITQRGA